jgi:OmpA-OmpF porin, OOP family
VGIWAKGEQQSMRTNWISILAAPAAVFLLAFVCAIGVRADETQVKGMIMSRTGETLLVTGQAGKTTVVLTAGTRTKDDRGLFGLDKEHMADTVLIPGLKVRVDGTTDSGGRVIAKTITVDGDDLETSEMIQAGLHPTAQQVEENVRTLEAHNKSLAAGKQAIEANRKDIDALQANQRSNSANREDLAARLKKIEEDIKDSQESTDRFSQLTDYDVKSEATLKFNVGSSTISPQDQKQLKQLAQIALGTRGYIVEVKGFADASGDALMNERLSEERAKRVVAFLMQQGNVPVRHIVAPGALGEYQPIASNETKAGRAENRRVEVKILVNKGIGGA